MAYRKQTQLLHSITHSRQSVLYHSQSSVCSVSLTVTPLFSITHSHPAVLYHSQSSVCTVSLTVVSLFCITHSRFSRPILSLGMRSNTTTRGSSSRACVNGERGQNANSLSGTRTRLRRTEEYREEHHVHQRKGLRGTS